MFRALILFAIRESPPGTLGPAGPGRAGRAGQKGAGLYRGPKWELSQNCERNVSGTAKTNGLKIVEKLFRDLPKQVAKKLF